MGITYSKEATSGKDTAAKYNKNRSDSSTVKRLERLRYMGSKMGRKRRVTTEGSTDQDADTIMQSRCASKGTKNSAASTSRRRTRSMTMADGEEDDEVDLVEDADADMRRIRRRMKGKSREGTQEENEGREHIRVQGEAIERLRSDSTTALPAQSAMMPASQDSDVEAAVALSEDGNMIVEPGGASLAEEAVHPLQRSTSAASNAFSTTRNPFDLTGEERSRARLQIAQALNDRQSTTEAADHYRPSMLSSLLTDILGLRTSQIAATTAATNAAPSSESTAQAAASLESRRRAGGTSVIVSGALISRTLSSRSVQATANGSEERQDGNTGSAAPLSGAASDAIPPLPVNGPTHGEEADGASMEPQIATVEEQAAMLIRLLSIATAATAASIMSRSSTQQAEPVAQEANVQSNGLSVSPGAITSTQTVDAVNRSAATTNELAATTSSPSTLTDSVAASASLSPSRPTSSLGYHGSWRSASQTYQSWRARFSALRRRLRNRTLPLLANESSNDNRQAPAPSIHDGESNLSNSAEVSPSEPIVPVASQIQSQRSSMRPESSTGSLDTLSHMLHEAIGRGVHRGSTASGDNGNHQEEAETSRTAEIEDGSSNVQVTLNAVRDGHLARGQEGTFDRFLFDLMGDLGEAVRRMPREGDETAAAPMSDGHDEEAMTLRRERDLRDGQLSFFRSFTFPAIPSLEGNDEQSASAISQGLLPCIVVGVRSMGSGHNLRRPTTTTTRSNTGARAGEFGQSQGIVVDVPRNSASTASATPASINAEATASNNRGASLSRFLLFVSGGHYPPQHPLFHSSSEEAARDLMILIEFLGAMTTFQIKPPTVTKEEIEKSHLQMVNGGLESIVKLVAEKKIMENTSERCLICLEDWKEVDENRRLLDCCHLFHAPCIDQWLTASNNSCPLCRRQAVLKKASNMPMTAAVESS